MKIVLIGDSIIRRLSVDQINNLKERLNNSELSNLASGKGVDTKELLNQLGNMDLEDVDYVIVSIGNNDAGKDFGVEKFEENLNRIIDLITKKSKLILLMVSPVDTIRFGKEGIEFNERLIKYYDSEKKLLLNHPEVKAIDNWDDFMNMMNKGEDMHIEDGVHLNELGYKVVFDKLEKLIMED